MSDSGLSRTFLVEVAPDGTVVVGELRGVTRTVSKSWDSEDGFEDGFSGTKIRLQGTIVGTGAYDGDEVKVRLLVNDIVNQAKALEERIGE